MSRLEIIGLAYAGEISAGDDLAAIVLAAAPQLGDGDVVVVAHKAVAKSEGRVVDLRTVEPSPHASPSPTSCSIVNRAINAPEIGIAAYSDAIGVIDGIRKLEKPRRKFTYPK